MNPYQATGSHAGVRVATDRGDDAPVADAPALGERWRSWRASPAGRGAALVVVAGTWVWIGAATVAVAGVAVARAARR